MDSRYFNRKTGEEVFLIQPDVEVGMLDDDGNLVTMTGFVSIMEEPQRYMKYKVLPKTYFESAYASERDCPLECIPLEPIDARDDVIMSISDAVEKIAQGEFYGDGEVEAFYATEDAISDIKVDDFWDLLREPPFRKEFTNIAIYKIKRR